MTTMFKALDLIISIVSFEFLLTSFNWSNGGTVIFCRTLCISIGVMCLYGVVDQCLDPQRLMSFSWLEMKLQIKQSLQLFAAVFAAVYIALYSRFSAQWTYLANLYNQIKQTEVSCNADTVILAQWKAGFIEDAYALHLVKKPMFAMIVKTWGDDANVKSSFEKDTHNGVVVFANLMKEVKKIVK